MKRNKVIHYILNCCIATIWLLNGLFCKVFKLVPRHQEIVARILGTNHSRAFTFLIGLSETAMAIWIVTGIRSRLNAATQILIIATMNTIEFFLAPDLLFWGKLNAVYAFILIVVIYYNEFYLNRKLAPEA
jgi:DoxX-like family